MAIVKLHPDAPAPVNHTTPETIQPPAESIFTSLIPESRINSLLKYAEGYPWTVNYYGQLLNVNNTVDHFDPSTPNLNQPYYEVRGLVLQVDSPLTSSYDQATGVTSVTGSAITPYKVTPNVGDLFTAQVDSGQDAIFIITSVTRKTHRKDTLYEIAYTLYSYTSDNPSFVASLKQRLNETYYFNKDTDYFNRDVLIAPAVKEATDLLKKFLHESKTYYFNTFIQPKTGSLLIPGVASTLYDPLLIEFITKTVDYDYLIETKFRSHTYTNKYIDQPTLLDAILQRSTTGLNFANKRFNFISSSALLNRARFGSIAHTGIDYILYPILPDTRSDIGESTVETGSEFMTAIKTVKNSTGENPLLIKTTNNNQEFVIPVLPEMFKNDYYIVSEQFYNFLNKSSSFEEISYVELLIAKFIQHEAISRQDLATTIQSYNKWSLLHQLYLLPVLWVIAGNYT